MFIVAGTDFNYEVAKFPGVEEELNVISTLAKSPNYVAHSEVAPLSIIPQLEINSTHQNNPDECDQRKEVENTSETQQSPTDSGTISFTISKFYDEPPKTKPINIYPGEYVSKCYVIKLTLIRSRLFLLLL